MSFNIHHRVETSDFSSIIADIIATAARSREIWNHGMARLDRVYRTSVEPEITAMAQLHDAVGIYWDDDAEAWEAWCLGVACGEIVLHFPPAPADPDDDLQDEDEDEAGEVLRQVEAA